LGTGEPGRKSQRRFEEQRYRIGAGVGKDGAPSIWNTVRSSSRVRITSTPQRKSGSHRQVRSIGPECLGVVGRQGDADDSAISSRTIGLS
jgi:hypothetical protein